MFAVLLAFDEWQQQDLQSNQLWPDYAVTADFAVAPANERRDLKTAVLAVIRIVTGWWRSLPRRSLS